MRNEKQKMKNENIETPVPKLRYIFVLYFCGSQSS